MYIAAAQDAAALYKSKCVSCHGANGAGKPAIKGSNLLTEDAKKKTDEALTDAILNGGAAKKAAHAYGKKGVNADQAKALTAHIRGLQK
ncbi:MAG: c-type cytochrome [Bryobacterales bacterium]|nr:c-type cytochrome [Bryobacterales bacterium]